jgi:hypothetical protein
MAKPRRCFRARQSRVPVRDYCERVDRPHRQAQVPTVSLGTRNCESCLHADMPHLQTHGAGMAYGQLHLKAGPLVYSTNPKHHEPACIPAWKRPSGPRRLPVSHNGPGLARPALTHGPGIQHRNGDGTDHDGSRHDWPGSSSPFSRPHCNGCLRYLRPHRAEGEEGLVSTRAAREPEELLYGQPGLLARRNAG